MSFVFLDVVVVVVVVALFLFFWMLLSELFSKVFRVANRTERELL